MLDFSWLVTLYQNFITDVILLTQDEVASLFVLVTTVVATHMIVTARLNAKDRRARRAAARRSHQT